MTSITFPIALLQRYHYDAEDRLISIQPPNTLANRRFYSGNELNSEVAGNLRRSHLRMGDGLQGTREVASRANMIRLFGTEQQGSVVQVLGAELQQGLAYTPYGDGADLSLPGFNSEQPDPLTGNYLLGNGYRAYSPVLIRFFSPDTFSPFEAGGFNPYSYCLGDPVNRADPSGHISWQAGVGIGLGVLGMLYGGYTLAFGGVALSAGMSAASAAVMVSGAAGAGAATAGVAQALIAEGGAGSGAASTLGWVGLALGAASFAAGMASNQWSPANALKPAQASGKVPTTRPGRARGSVPTAFLAQYGEAVQHERALVGHFPPAGRGAGAMRVLIGMLNATDLTALSLASSGMQEVVYASLRPLSRVLTQPWNSAGFVRTAEAIGTGQVLGMLPAQLTQNGITEALLSASPVYRGTAITAQARASRMRVGIQRQISVRSRFR